MVDAAKAAGVSLLVWSGLDSVSEISKGKYLHVDHFDGKADITAYARLSGVPLVIAQIGWYGTNHILIDGYIPTKEADGSYVLALPIGEDAVLPIIDATHDYGLFVRAAIESPALGPGTEILASGEDISIRDMLAQLSQSALSSHRFFLLTVLCHSYREESCLQAHQRRRVYGRDQVPGPCCVGTSGGNKVLRGVWTYVGQLGACSIGCANLCCSIRRQGCETQPTASEQGPAYVGRFCESGRLELHPHVNVPGVYILSQTFLRVGSPSSCLVVRLNLSSKLNRGKAIKSGLRLR